MENEGKGDEDEDERAKEPAGQRQKKDADLLFFNFILFLVGDEDMDSSECILSPWRTRK